MGVEFNNLIVPGRGQRRGTILDAARKETYSCNSSPTSALSNVSCHTTRRTRYSNWRPTPPARPGSMPRVLLPMVLPFSLAPAAARRVSIRGSKVSFRWFQKISRECFFLRSSENPWTPMSCSPLSWLLVRVERYVYNCGSASLSRGAGLDETTRLCDTRAVRKVDVSSGIGSSAFVEWCRNGKNGLYGSGCATRESASEGTSVDEEPKCQQGLS